MEATLSACTQVNHTDANRLEIVYVEVCKLRPFRAQASDKVTEHRVRAIAEALFGLGQLTPILITPDGEIIAGHNRWNAAKKAGWKHINAIVYTGDPNEAFVAEHSWSMQQNNWAESVGRGLPLELVANRQKPTAQNIAKSVKVFGGINPLNDLGYPPSAWKTVERVHQLLLARLDPENVPTVRAIAKWTLHNDALPILKRLVNGKSFPSKRIATAIANNRSL